MLWAVSSHFNPQRYRNRVHNYQQFRAGLRRDGVPLLTVELAFGDTPFDLEPAPDVIRIRTRDVMWQKERALNIAISRLPQSCDKVAWIDGDLLFHDPRWAEQAEAALEEYAAVQLFEHVEEPGVEDEHRCRHGIAAGFARGATLRDPVLAHGFPGFAWAARREVLPAPGLYDRLILGAADYAMVHAMRGEIHGEHCFPKRIVNAQEFACFVPWAEELHRRVGGRLSFLPGTITHLWHGRKSDRRYGTRLLDMAPWAFDPEVDLRLGEDQCWQWASDKPGLHAYVADYFRKRREDG